MVFFNSRHHIVTDLRARDILGGIFFTVRSVEPAYLSTYTYSTYTSHFTLHTSWAKRSWTGCVLIRATSSWNVVQVWAVELVLIDACAHVH